MSVWQVYKFGGSSLGAERRLPVMLRRVAEARRPLALVVSALGDTTEWLLEAGRLAAAADGTGAAAAVARALALARTRAAEVLGPGGREELEASWAPILDDAARALSALSLARTLEPVSLDLLLSVGERLSSQLVAAALRAGGVPGLAVDARDVFRTDARHGDASVDLGASRRLVLERRADWERHIPVVTGFIGRGPDGTTTTLGRNGSDYAATTLSALLGASEVTIWTDVDGVMTADPELVEEAYPVPRLTWHEAQELAHFGLRMFHRRTVLPLEKSGAACASAARSRPAGARSSMPRATPTRTGRPASPASSTWHSSPWSRGGRRRRRPWWFGSSRRWRRRSSASGPSRSPGTDRAWPSWWTPGRRSGRGRCWRPPWGTCCPRARSSCLPRATR